MPTGSKFVVCLKPTEPVGGGDQGIKIYVGVGPGADVGAFQFTSVCLSTGAKVTWDASGTGGLAASMNSIISASPSGKAWGERRKEGGSAREIDAERLMFLGVYACPCLIQEICSEYSSERRESFRRERIF